MKVLMYPSFFSQKLYKKVMVVGVHVVILIIGLTFLVDEAIQVSEKESGVRS